MKYQAKIVPRAKPNEEGEWVEIEAPNLPYGARWREVSDLLSPHIPADHVLIAYRREVG
jgi:hypothetical protein